MQEYPLPVLSSLALSSVAVPPSTSTATAQGSSTSAGTSAQQAAEASLFTIVDPEIVRKNPVEAKHRRLVRDHRNGPLDRELKPNAKIRDELNVRCGTGLSRLCVTRMTWLISSFALQEILRYPPTQELATPQRDLLWKFRFYLTRDKRALTKFLKSVVWSDPGEAKQAVETLLPMWSEIEMDDALELLGPAEGFRDTRVRAYAVRQLERADDEVRCRQFSLTHRRLILRFTAQELMLYLLQLVQALKFEPAPSSTSPTSSHVSPSASLRHSHAHIHRHASSLRPSAAASPHDSLPTLEDFLVERSASNPVLGNHFYWYIQVEREDKTRGSMFEGVARKFERRMQEVRKSQAPIQPFVC